MTTKMKPVTVNILGREYCIACPIEEEQVLHASARHLEHKMREVKETGKVISLDAVAVIAGLNIASELLATRDQHTQHEQRINQQFSLLQKKIQDVLKEENN